jgi:hypothetical protein
MYSVWIDDVCVISCRTLINARWEANMTRAFHPAAQVFVLPA